MSKDAPVSFALVRGTARYYWCHRRYVALLRALWHTVARRWGSELCEECGGRNQFIWWSPQPLWNELHDDRYSGLLCPRCFDAKARAAGIMVNWTPMVVGRRNGAQVARSGGEMWEPTTNWWLDETRDALMMGEPDPDFHPDGLARQPQPTWARIKAMYAPDLPSVYPDENRAPAGWTPPGGAE